MFGRGITALCPVAVCASALLFAAPAQSGEAPASQPVPAAKPGGNPVVEMKTSMGIIEIELFKDKAPISVENFLGYVKDGFYNGTIFHRIIPTFMIQGGGFTPDMKEKSTKAPIKNEAANGLKNTRGTVAMARTGIVDSATAQFFINVVDSSFLDHGARDFGYAVFGKVISGMDVVDKIKAVKTGAQDVPLQPVVIESAKLKSAAPPTAKTQ